MRLFALVLCAMGSALAGREALAQSFWYAPPGYGYGDYYGLDFGGGVGYGYGAGVALPVSPQMLMGSYTPPYVGVQDFGDSFVDDWTDGSGVESTPHVFPSPKALKKAVKTASTGKNSHAKKKTVKPLHAKANH